MTTRERVGNSTRNGRPAAQPGRPRVIHTPGHTAGNAALSLADRDVLIVGDT